MNFKLLKLAWRNIWRNKRRAIITISSIVVSLLLVLVMRQMKFWMIDYTLDNSVGGYVGYIQISDSSYVDEMSLDNTLEFERVPVDDIRKIKGVREVLPRFQTGALLSTGIKSKFAGVLGIQPSIDNSGLDLDIKLLDGELLKDSDDQIMITESMSKYYKVGVGDSLVMIGSGYQGYTAAGIYRVKGILNFPAGDMASMVFMSIAESQSVFASPDRYTGFLVNLDSSDDIGKTLKQIRTMIPDSEIAVRRWEEVLPGLKQGLDVDEVGDYMMVGILYMIVGFGIFGTVVMLYNERLFEFGILSAIGMRKNQILATVLIELNLLSIIGILLGIGISLPILYYYNLNPIELGGDIAEATIQQGFAPLLGMGLYLKVFIKNALIIWVMSAVVSLYVVVKILRLKALDAMRQN